MSSYYRTHQAILNAKLVKEADQIDSIYKQIISSLNDCRKEKENYLVKKLNDSIALSMDHAEKMLNRKINKFEGIETNLKFAATESSIETDENHQPKVKKNLGVVGEDYRQLRKIAQSMIKNNTLHRSTNWMALFKASVEFLYGIEGYDSSDHTVDDDVPYIDIYLFQVLNNETLFKFRKYPDVQHA